MGEKRLRASNGISGNSAYFAFVLLHAASIELCVACAALISWQPYPALMFPLVLIPVYLMFLPLALVVVFINWWFRFTRVAFAATATLTFCCFNALFLFSSRPAPPPLDMLLWPAMILQVVVATIAATLWWEVARRKAGGPQAKGELIVPLRRGA